MRLRKVYVLFNARLEEAAVQGIYTSKKRAQFALTQLPEGIREKTEIDEWAVNTTPAEARLLYSRLR